MFTYSKIFPLLIIVSVLTFSIKLTEVITGVSNMSSAAFAKSAEDEGDDEKPMEGKEHGDSHAETASKGHIDKDAMSNPDVVEGEKANAPKWRDASDSDLDVTGIKLEMFEDLSKRRKELEKAEQDIKIKEALLKAAEQELDRKVQELSSLRQEIEKLLELQSGNEQKRIDSLVKIYEGMKPKDAARIFNTLDLDILVRVMSKMSERKVAPVLAAMNPERARTVTIMLAEEKSLPILQ